MDSRLKQKVTFFLKSGNRASLLCESCTVNTNSDGKITGYNISVTNVILPCFNIDAIEAIIVEKNPDLQS